MGTMTYRVIDEYLQYPSIMRSKSVILKELEFPGVTVCPLSLVPKIFAREAGLSYMLEMDELLESLPKYNVSEDEKVRCLKDPMCSWSWFDNDCYCENNPCDTLYCYPDTNKTDDFCLCSLLLCDWHDMGDGCDSHQLEDGNSICYCRDSFRYSRYKQPERIKNKKACNSSAEECKPPDRPLPSDFQDALDRLNTTPEIASLLKRLKRSKTDDAKDVERFFNPTLSVIDNYGMPFDNMVLSCSYGPEVCDRDFETLYSPIYGKCYMFNYVGYGNYRNKSVKTSRQSGRDHGLILYMQSRKRDSIPLLTRKLGVRIYIHNPHTLPTMAEESIDIRPGDLSSIDIDYMEIHRLGYPWGTCVGENDLNYNTSEGLPYSQVECERHCINMEVYRRCRCYHPNYMPATLIPAGIPICSTNSTSWIDKCFLSVVEASDDGKISCDCPPACKEYHYGLTNSASQLNPDFFRILKKARTLSTNDGKAYVTDSEAEGFSLMGVQIFYNSFFVTHINETAIYSWESLVANIGGNMGLFLGLSIVTILEVLEFFTELITRLITGNRNSPKNKTFVLNF